MSFVEIGYFEEIKNICSRYLNGNYDLCYLRAMHEKMRTHGADTIIVGSSHAMNGIIESELIAAGDVIQFSISSQDLYYDFLHIRKAVEESPKPIKRCLINLGYYMLYQDISLSTIVRPVVERVYLNLFGREYAHNLKDASIFNPNTYIKYDKYVYPESALEEMTRFWSENALMEQSSYYGQLLKREDANVLGLKKVNWAMLDEKGKIEYATNRTKNGHNKHINHTESRKENEQILHDMIKFLNENDIKTYFFITPYTRYYNDLICPEYMPDILTALDQLEWPVEFLDMNDYAEEFDDSDFLDSDHLNLRGAHKATALLNGFIELVEEQT